MRRALPWLVLALTLAGCPQERPGAEKRIPPQRIPPAMSLETPGADAGTAGDAGHLGSPGDAGTGAGVMPARRP